MDNSAKDNILRSWKEIAAHLGYDQRTCYRWEQRFGMPVHRAEGGGSKSRVVAYKDELDRWFQAIFTNSNRPAPPKPPSRPASLWRLLGIVPALAFAAYLVIRTMTSASGQPADFHIRDSTLIILGEDGKELWRKATKVEGLQDERYYRTYFQAPDLAVTSIRLPSLVIRDINADGQNEVLFAVQKRDDAYGEGDLYCYSSHGEEMWHFHAGREMRFGGRTYSPDYRIYGFGLHDFNGDGRQEIAVISYHYPQWPCQLVLLDSRGRTTGEFWNSGYLNDIAWQDLDSDGRQELIVGGVNNQYGGCLIVFEPARLEGCSPQSGEFKADTWPPGSERFYVRFPRTDVSLALGDIVEGLQALGISGNNHLVAYTIYSLAFEFDFGLRCLSVDVGHGYMIRHNELRAAGKLRSSYNDPAYREMVRTGVRYWDGSKWVAEPTPNFSNVRATR
jgi:hypothetical protein